jgi:tetratricopeptide (TPR) repeat protein
MAGWETDFQTTIDAWSAGDLAAGRTASERLLRRDDLPDEIVRLTRRNATFYLQSLEDLAPSFAANQLLFPVPDGWSRLNPTIAQGPDGLMAIVRSSNYSIDERGYYRINNDADGIIRTTNYLASLTPDGSIAALDRIDDQPVRKDPPLFPVAGFEDCRLVWHDGGWWASATRREGTVQGTCQMVLLRLEGTRAVDLIPLSDGVLGHEKNWMPVVAAGPDLLFVYEIAPTVVIRIDLATQKIERVSKRRAPALARHLRGGGQVVPVAGGWLAIAHFAVHFDGRARTYVHRWVWFDSNWRLRKISPAFFLRERGVEFAAGLARDGDSLLVSFGVWDREAWLGRVALAEVMSLLQPADGAGGEPGTRAEQDMSQGITPVDRRPTIASTTMSGNAESEIGAALRSVVDWVDWCLLIDTGISDDSLRIAREIAGPKLVVRPFPWSDDFSAVRNFALAAAHELGADWAMTLDTDERIHLQGLDIHQALQEATAETLHVLHTNGTYGKERFFRLPARGTWRGPTHEAYSGAGSIATLPHIEFDELDKDDAQYRRKAERDVAILTRYVAQHPGDPRWHYYLGDSLAGLERHEEAVGAFRACAALRGWDEESAWALYRAAESLIALGRPVEAIEACAEGMSRHAGLAELPWLASYAAWRAGRPAQAVYWARISVMLGHYLGCGATVPRIGFRHPPALWEGPFDVLRFALRQIGDDAGAEEAERLYEEALEAREAQE